MILIIDVFLSFVYNPTFSEGSEIYSDVGNGCYSDGYVYDRMVL